MYIPAILKVAVVFVVMLLAIRRKVSLGNTFVLSALFLGALFGLGPLPAATSALESALSAKTILLCVIVSLILVLSTSMEVSGHMKRLLAGFEGIISSSRINLVIFPAMIGLLPMPGGAIFSAPMVREIGESTSLTPDYLSYVNYWFRHIWEYWWPLYPGLILAVTLAGVSMWSLAIYFFPLTIVSVLFGYYPLARHPFFREVGASGPRPPLGPFIRELVPILLVIVMGPGLGQLFAWMSPEGFPAIEAGLICSLTVAVGWVWFRNRMKCETIRGTVLSPKILEMAYMIVSIMVFQGIMIDSNAVLAVSAELEGLGVPLMVVVMVLPFLAGLVVGITFAFVGSTYPILLALIASMGREHFLLQYLMLAQVSGFMGVLLSPLHLCFQLSNGYFGVSMGEVYRHLRLPVFAVLSSAVLYFLLSLLVKGALMG